jgi:sugar phosphate isomerase/epimerase
VVREAVPGVEALGAIVLNHGVGGLNPLAVEIAARAGARFVWFPTVDAANEAREAMGLPPEKKPQWARLQEAFRDAGLLPDPISILDGRGRLCLEARAVLQVAARYSLVVATGHLSRGEILKVVEAALEEGVRWVVVTHPDYPTQDLPLADQRYLAGQGVFLERCFAPSHTGKVPWEKLFRAIREAGVEQSFLSTDLGQPKNPPVEEGLALFADRLLQAGFTEEEVRHMAVAVPTLLAKGGEA